MESSMTDGSFAQKWSAYTLKPYNMCTAIPMALQQRAWLIARHQMARLKTADVVFTANSDIFSLLTRSSIKESKIGTLLALYCWITPSLVVLTVETLATVVGIMEKLASCPSVRTLNFGNEANFDWSKDFKSTYFDYWNAASTVYTSVLPNKAALTRGPLVRDESTEEVCSDGWNSTKNPTTYSWPRPQDLGVFKNEPIIWIDFVTVKNVNEQQPKNKEEKGWDEAYTPFIFGCEHYEEVEYTVRTSTTEAVNTTIVSKNTPRRTSKKNSVPESYWAHPQDFKVHRQTAAYRVTGNKLRQYVAGSISTATEKTTAHILLTSLGPKISPPPITDLRQGILKLYKDLVISPFF
ncbi:hypothetical protein FGADI_2494 [Fusarium gaditjirri]|uniref:Uncharacterized protein n=1 Tax=Fusarium gaditjirri TaxID=282569 RepID=A0A8H4TI64_9HYPO|nr:hypothetical protein FGADI_2494 [Fusarium gaditjirri]